MSKKKIVKRFRDLILLDISDEHVFYKYDLCFLKILGGLTLQWSPVSNPPRDLPWLSIWWYGKSGKVHLVGELS